MTEASAASPCMPLYRLSRSIGFRTSSLCLDQHTFFYCHLCLPQFLGEREASMAQKVMPLPSFRQRSNQEPIDQGVSVVIEPALEEMAGEVPNHNPDLGEPASP